MKNPKSKIASAAIALFFLCAFKISAQFNCPYTIVNNLPCDITVCWEIVNPSNKFQCGHICSSPVTIPAGQSLPVACCGNPFDIYVTVINIGNVGSGQSQAVNGNVFPSHQSDGGTCPMGCGTGGGSTWNIQWTTTATTVF
jgi:hypothetical protein